MKTIQIIFTILNFIWIPIFFARGKGDWTAKWVGGFVSFIWLPLAILGLLFN